MLTFFKTNDATEFSSPKRAVVRYEGRSLNEIQSVHILWSKGIRFSTSRGKARGESPLKFLLGEEAVPARLRNIVLNDHSIIGIKCWGRIDYLVKYCGYHLMDERK